jgi:gamma-glutamyltranspeptidase
MNTRLRYDRKSTVAALTAKASAIEVQNANRPCVMGVTHTVAAGHYMSAQVGLQMLEAGGNAIDAGVAAGSATGVLEGIHVSIGGVARS